MIKYEEKLLEFISIVERDYEVRYGYICITFGLLSITMSYVFFKNFAIYGILALAIVDTVSSITTYFTPKRRKIYKHSDLSIATTFTIFTLALYLITLDLPKSIAISTISVLTELISPEDNLTLPIVASLTAFILKTWEPNL
jgi:dolichol kinase